jgi:hypothetical protein
MPEPKIAPPVTLLSPVTREALYERVWTTPIQHLAAEYGVSGSYLARVCSVLNVPRPPVGYWQKKAVGKDKPRPPLPEALLGDQVSWSRNTPLAQPTARPQRAVRTARVMDRPIVPSQHPLLRGTEALFRRSRKIDDYEYLRPYKQLLPDIVTAEPSLLRALELCNALYSALERKGHRVMLAPTDQSLQRAKIEERETPGKDRKYGRYSHGTIWVPYRPTVTFVGVIPIGLTLVEMTERVTLRHFKGKYVRQDSDIIRAAKPYQLANSWTHEQDLPSGRFRLVAYSPHPGVDWQTSWQETGKRGISAMIPEIVKALEGVAGDLAQKTIAANEAAERRQREWEEQRERWRREEDQRQIAAAKASSQKQLSEIIQQWSAAMAIEQFFREAEGRIAQAEPGRQEQLSARLSLAREMVGTLDPLDFLENWVAPAERYKTRYPDE